MASRRFILALVLTSVLLGPLAAQSTRAPDLLATADRIFVLGAEVPLADGFGGSLDLYQFVGSSPLTINAGLSYANLPIEGITSLNLVAPIFGAGVRVPVVQSGSFVALASASVGGGPYLAAFSDVLLQADGTPYENQTGIGGFARAMAHVAVHLNPALTVEVGVDYGWHAGLAHSMRFRLGGSLAMGELGNPLELVETEARELYPSLASRYAIESPISLQVRNRSRFPVDNATITAQADGLIAGIASVAELESLPPGGTGEVRLRFPVSSEGALNANQRTVQIGLGVDARVADQERPGGTLGVIETQLLGRNSLTWTDDRKAASFVTPTGEAALMLAREISSTVRGLESTLDPMLRYAMAATEAMAVLGIEYAVDPNLPSFVASQANEQVVDYLQYPEQTLRFAAGDCDDLSILFASILEAAGVPSAFITIPGHLFAAARLSMTPDQASQAFASSEDYIVHEGRVWLPIETTIADQGFVAAWKTGAQQWRAANASGEAVLIPIAEAWSAYPPAVAQPMEEARELDAERLLTNLNRELLRFVQLEFAPAIERIEARIASGAQSVRSYTNLGVLYAQAGLLDQAETYFAQALELERHPNALINLGNVRRLQERPEEALVLYAEAERLRPSSTQLWLAIALTLRELGRDEESERYYSRYAERRPTDALAYSYLGDAEGGARASRAATGSSILLWQSIAEDRE